MSQNDLLKAADEIANMIADARNTLAKGQAVDLVPIEARVADIYGEVSATMFHPNNGHADLRAKLDSLLPELTALEADLTAQHQKTGA